VNDSDDEERHGPDDEATLMASLAAGDRRAAEVLVERTYSQVYAALVRLTGDGDLAGDLTQETYRKAWQALSRFDRRSQFGTWLYRIAYNTFLNHVRRPQLLSPLDERLEAQVREPGPGLDDQVGRREVAARLRRAVLGLPEELRFTVTARFWADLEVAEIAELEDVTGAAIRKRIKKAVGYLKTVLAEEAA
jgi:RNA polymerase sigma-70 factor (ECF subfamily)